MGVDGEPDENGSADDRSPDEEITCSLLPHRNLLKKSPQSLLKNYIIIFGLTRRKSFDLSQIF